MRGSGGGGEESYTLLAADCATAKAEQVKTWTPPTDHRLEQAPAAFLTWLRYAENAVKVFGSAYGLEHVPERLAFLSFLCEANEEDENAYPVNYCIRLYEELNAVWCEAIRESRRQLCAKLGTENPRLEDLKLIALAPSDDGTPNFQFPRVWDLKDPQSYFQTVVLPRQQRAPADTGNCEDEVETDPKAGKGPNLRLRRNDREELARLRAATPQNLGRPRNPVPKTKKPLCWDAACHIGCARGSSCPNAHEPLPPMGKLDPSVAMQIVRRGGLRGDKKVDPKEVDDRRVAQLRAQMKDDQQSKQQDGGKPEGKSKTKAKKAKAGWQLPPDFQGPLTVMEKELSEVGLGPDLSWHTSFRPGQVTDDTPVQDPTATERLRVYREILEEGLLSPLAAFTPYLQSHVAARLVNACLDGTPLTLQEVVVTAADEGHPHLAQEAQACLEAGSFKIGQAPEDDPPEAVVTSRCMASSSAQYSGGAVHLTSKLYPKGLSLPFEDHVDKLEVKEGSPPLFGAAPAMESRQCLCLHVGRVFAQDPGQSVTLAQDLRAELWQQASEARRATWAMPLL